MGTWVGISKILLVARLFPSLPTQTVDTDTLMSCEGGAAVAAAAATAVAEVLRGDSIMGDLSVFSVCKLTTESMITSNESLKISGTALVRGGIGELIVIAIALFITFKDALTPDCVRWINDTTFFIMKRREVYTDFYKL